MVGLSDEFAETRALLEREVARTETSITLIVGILDEARGEPVVVEAEDVENALRRLLLTPTLDASTGTRQALISAGKLDLIQDEALRTAIAGWERFLNDAQDNELTMRPFVAGVIVPFLARHGVPLSRVLVRSSLSNVPPPEQSVAAFSKLVRDPEFAALVSYRLWWLRGSRSQYQRALEATERILDLIHQNLRREEVVAS